MVQVAAEEIHQKAISSGNEQETPTEAPEISDDWLNQFEKEASQKSSEEMQLLFGRILAGEIQRPSSFSIKNKSEYWISSKGRLTLNIDELVRGFKRGIVKFKRQATLEPDLRTNFVRYITD